MLLISYIKISFLKKTIIPIFLFSLVLLIIVPFFGVEIKGAKRWLDLILFRLQPIEIIKPFFVLVTASLISSNRGKNINYSFLFSLIILSMIIVLLFEPTRCRTINFTNYYMGIYRFYFRNKKLVTFYLYLSFLFFSLITALLIFPDKFGYIVSRLNTFLILQKEIVFRPTKL